MKNEGKWGVGSLFFCVNVSNNLSFLLEASQVAQQVKNPSVMQEMRETRVQSLGQEDPLEKGMATHFSILAWRIHGQRSLAGYKEVAKNQTRLSDFHALEGLPRPRQ